VSESVIVFASGRRQAAGGERASWCVQRLAL